MEQQRIDFERIAADLLADARSRLTEWFPAGKFHGKEFKVGNLQGEPGESLSINCATGVWKDFAADIGGADLISLYAAAHSMKQSEAARELGNLPALPLRRVSARLSAPASPAAALPPFSRPPPGEPLPDCRHAKHGAPSAVYEYRDAEGLLFLVARYDPPAGADHGARKQFCPWSWVGNGTGWAPKAPPAPRPLFNLAELAARLDAKVLIVEGEKAALSAARLLSGYVCMTWAGGAAATATADWLPLAGRNVDIWPDADRPGIKAGNAIAAALMEIGCTVRVINPTDVAEGWDAADAEAAGWSGQRVIEWAKARIGPADDGGPMPAKRRGANHLPATGCPPGGTVVHVEQPPGAGGVSAYHFWRSAGLDCNAGGMPYAHEANIRAILTHHPMWAGRIYHDQFRDRIVFTPESGPAREWRDSDDTDLTIWLQFEQKLPKVTVNCVARAVESTARTHGRNPLTAWLDGLTWDATPRLEDWLADVLAVRKTPYTVAVARNWLVSMVARAYRPGCQVDTMPVLEGKMGKGKSSALEILGGEYYASTTDPFGGKAFLETIIGVWLVEIPDLAGFSKRDHSHIIATVTQRTDRYRQSYGRRAGNYPRTCILAATAETDDYLADSRGIRRFWPIRCGESGDLDLNYLRTHRDQLWAEAVAVYKAGTPWWEVPGDEATAEQEARSNEDTWYERVCSYIDSRGSKSVTIVELLSNAIERPLEQQNHIDKVRIAAILRRLKYTRKVTRIAGGRVAIVWTRPSI